MRYAAGLAAACVVLVGVLLVGRFVTASDAPQNWRERELLLLKAAYERMQADADTRPSASAMPSLRQEQQAILAEMRQIAAAMPRDRLPQDLAPLLQTAGVPQQATPLPQSAAAAPAEPNAATGRSAAPPPAIALRPGLTTARAAPPEPGLGPGIEPASDLRLPLRPAKAAAKKPPAKPASDKPASDKPAPDKLAVAKSPVEAAATH